MGEGGGGVESNFFLGQVSGSQTKSPDLLILDLKYFNFQNLRKNSDFLVISVASLVDKTRGRTRIMSYAEANRVRRELLELASAGFMRLVTGEVTDYGVTWSSATKRLSQYQEFQTYLDIFGLEAAQRLFRRHVKKLKDCYLSDRVARYLNLLPEVLHELFPDIASLGKE